MVHTKLPSDLATLTLTFNYIRGCNDIIKFTDFVTIIYFYYFKINFLHIFELRIIRH